MMITYKKLCENLEETSYVYHGSPHKFETLRGGDVFVAKSKEEARRYGHHLYRILYNGKLKFETPTIGVLDSSQVRELKHIEHNPNQVIYRT